MVTAPSIIVSIDDTADVTFFFGENEEEEENENLKLHFEFDSADFQKSEVAALNSIKDYYMFGLYSIPHLNILFPPPDSV